VKTKGLLILVILIGLMILSGCSIITFTTPPCCTPPNNTPVECWFTVIAKDRTWGIVKYEILSTGETINTWEYIDCDGIDQVIIKNIPCGEVVDVYIEDLCGEESHRIRVYTKPGNNIIEFTYWKDSKSIHIRVYTRSVY